MAFYGLASNTVSSQDKTEDELDFEYLGDPTKLWLNYFEKGVGRHEASMTVPANRTVCLANYGEVVTWYVDGSEVRKDTVQLGPMYRK